MVVDKLIILLEIIAMLFIVVRSDVTQLCYGASKAKEHIYGALWIVLREFAI